MIIPNSCKHKKILRLVMAWKVKKLNVVGMDGSKVEVFCPLKLSYFIRIFNSSSII